MLFHNLHGICRCLPAVDQNRKIQLSCQFQLPYEPFFLHFSRLIVPVIIQTDLAYRNHFLLFKQLFHLCKVLFIQAADLIRMNPDCRIYKWIFLCKCNNLPAGIICCTDIYNCANALLFHRIQQFYSVLIKLLIVIMCMCIKYHISLRGRRIFKNNVLNPPSQIKNVLSPVSQYLSHLFHMLSQGISWLSHPYPKVFHILIHIMWITCVTDTVYRCRILEIYIKQGR